MLYPPGTLLQLKPNNGEDVVAGLVEERDTSTRAFNVRVRSKNPDRAPDGYPVTVPFFVIASISTGHPPDVWVYTYELLVMGSNGKIGWIRQDWCEPL